MEGRDGYRWPATTIGYSPFAGANAFLGRDLRRNAGITRILEILQFCGKVSWKKEKRGRRHSRYDGKRRPLPGFLRAKRSPRVTNLMLYGASFSSWSVGEMVFRLVFFLLFTRRESNFPKKQSAFWKERLALFGRNGNAIKDNLSKVGL